MATPGYPRVSLVGVVVLALSGCAGPSLAPSSDRVGPDAGPAPSAVRATPAAEEPAVEKTEPSAVSSADRWGVTWDRLGRDIDFSLEDHKNYYTWGNLTALGVGIGAVAPLANTSADEHIRRWYQRRIRGETSDEFAQVMEYTGQFWLVLPVCVEGAALLGHGDDDYAFDAGLAEWSNRSLRAVCVGAPPMLALYAVLGSSRPDRNDSRWHPFNDIHGVSGHTFMGAVPFLTAAEMTDNELLKYTLVAGSFLTGWARINDDKHYFSQVALGWWMAYLAVRRVDDTQSAAPRPFEILPFCADGPGIGLQFRY